MKYKELIEINEKNFITSESRKLLEDVAVLSGINILTQELNDEDLKSKINKAIEEFTNN